MAEPTIQLGGGNWAGKTDNLLGYYKEGERFYKQDFTFSRSTTGTYTDKDGYIQEMPYNLIRQSNTFDTTWINSNTTETSGQTGYDNSNNAWLLEKSASNGYIKNDYPFDGSNYTFSTYLKTGSTNWGAIFMGGRVAFFNLDNGTKGTQNGISSSIESVGNGWYRCSIVFNYNGSSSVRIYPANGDDDLTGTSGSIFIQNAQLVKGTSAKTYFPTTTRLNMPRVDYLNNSNGSLILEPQRSNLYVYSSEINDTRWTSFSGGTGTTPIMNSSTEIAKDGSLTACEWVFNTGVGTSSSDQSTIYYSSISTSIGVTYSFSVWVYSSLNNIEIQVRGAGSNYEKFTLSSGWNRITRISDATGTSTIPVIGLRQSVNGTVNNNITVKLWGAQLEEGDYATTLINTSGSSVTRNADACSITNVADRIGQTEGVLFAEISALANDGTNRMISLSDGTSDNRVLIKYDNISNRAEFFVIVSGVSQYSFITVVDNLLAYNKIALKYKVNDFSIWFNGNKLDSNTSGNTFAAYTLNNLSFDSGGGGSDFYGKVKQIQVYNTALTDSELAILTTL